MSAAPAISIRFGGRREIGYQRQENQDQFSRFSSPLGEVFLIADGMGGHEGGAVAANMATSGFERHFLALAGQLPVQAALTEAARLINADIMARGHATQTSGASMGSTLAALVIQDRGFIVAHIGDTRVYLFREGRLKQLTHDHTATQKLVDAGLMTQEESRAHPDAGVLTRALGQSETMEIEVSERQPLLEGDVLLMCSDGLSGYVRDAPIEERLRKIEDPQKAADGLAELALEAGGCDNISIWVVRAARAAAQPAAPPQAAAAPTPARKAVSSTQREAPPARRRWLLWTCVAFAAAGGGGWLAWQSPAVRNPVQRMLGTTSGPAKTSGGEAPGKAVVSGKATPGARTAPAAEAKPAAEGAGQQKAAPAASPAASAPAAAADKARIILVHLPTPGMVGKTFLNELQTRLKLGGYDSAEAELSDPEKDPAWRMAPPGIQTAKPGSQGIVVAVYLSGFEAQAARACQLLECAAAPRLVGESDLRLFESAFSGRHIAIFAQLPATPKKETRK